MKQFLGMSALALALAGVPTQDAAASGIRFNLGFSFNIGFEYGGHQRLCGRGCFRNCGGDYLAVMPGEEQAMPQVRAQPMPEGQRTDEQRAVEQRGTGGETLQWGYPGLGYSYHHPVSYQRHQNPPAATYYYPQHYYYPAYQSHGITFDR